MIFINSIMRYIAGFLVVVVATQGILIYNYKEEIADMALTALVNQVNEVKYLDAIEMQNNAIIDIGIHYESKVDEYNKSLSKENVVQYKNRYLEATDENTTECEVLINTLNNISRIGL